MEESFDDKILPNFVPAPIDRNTQRGRFGTAQGAATWTAIAACWSAEIYIPELGHRFWKLMLQVRLLFKYTSISWFISAILQIISRYKVWLKSNIDTLIERQRVIQSDSVRML